MGDMLAANSFDLADVIAYRRLESKSNRALLVAISGIDASGKGSLASRLSTNLKRLGMNVATIGIDPWQTSPALRQEAADPAEHFYLHGYRFEDLFEWVVEPLRRDRALDLEVELLDPHAGRSRGSSSSSASCETGTTCRCGSSAAFRPPSGGRSSGTRRASRRAGWCPTTSGFTSRRSGSTSMRTDPESLPISTFRTNCSVPPSESSSQDSCNHPVTAAS